jgi:hypothetical protein
MFDRLKKKLETKEPKVTEDAKPEEPEVTEKPKTTEKPSNKVKRTKKPAKEKPAEKTEDPRPQSPPMHADLKTADPFIGIKEYSSAVEITEKIEKEIAETKSSLGEYLRQLDDKRDVAEKTKRLHDVVAKIANKKEAKENTNQIEVNGLEIVLDSTALNELIAIESVVKSHQQRLMALQQAQEALKALDQVSDTEGIRYLTLEREGIPEQILLKLS